MSRHIFPAVFFLLIFSSIAMADGESFFSFGRQVSSRRNSRLQLSVGQVRQIDFIIEETTRAFYDVTGREDDQERAQIFDGSDFNMEEGYLTLGVKWENARKYFTWKAEASVMNPSTEAEARRNYYISIGREVEYEGKLYDHMFIPEGDEFEVEIIGGTLELRSQITPFTLQPVQNLRIIPWVELGLFTFIGQYILDAGEPRGSKTYQIPPVDFVEGGRSRGFAGMGLPEWGAGGEVRIGNDDGYVVSLSGSYTVCEYRGGTRFFTSSRHREKRLDLNHRNIRLQANVELPTASGRAWLVGARYQRVNSDALIESTGETVEEIIERRERFDKEIEFDYESLEFLVGFTF